MDPAGAIAEICKREGLWLHLDAAYAGSAAILPEHRSILDGIEHADSFVFNPHKWLFTPIDASALYTRHPETFKRAFSLVPEYLTTPVSGQVVDLMDYGVQLGRRFRALKLWWVLRSFGGDVKNRHPKMADKNCFSGSGNVDLNNTAGWQKGDEKTIVLAFTDTGCGEALAYSTDRGKTWTIVPGARPNGWFVKEFDRMDEGTMVALAGGDVVRHAHDGGERGGDLAGHEATEQHEQQHQRQPDADDRQHAREHARDEHRAADA